MRITIKKYMKIHGRIERWNSSTIIDLEITIGLLLCHPILIMSSII